MKLNDKGSTLVEVIITFSMLMVVMLSMTGLVVSLRKSSNLKANSSKIVNYNSNIIKTINDDLIKNKYDSLEECSGNYEDYILCKVINFKNGSSKELIINMGMKNIVYNGIKYDMESYVKIDNSLVYVREEDNFFVINIPIKYQNKDFNIKIVDPLEL